MADTVHVGSEAHDVPAVLAIGLAGTEVIGGHILAGAVVGLHPLEAGQEL